MTTYQRLFQLLRRRPRATPAQRLAARLLAMSGTLPEAAALLRIIQTGR